MDDVAHIGFVDPHPESDSGHNYFGLFHQKRILVGTSRSSIHPGVVGQSPDIVRLQDLRKIVHFFPAQTIYYSRFRALRQDVFDDFSVNFIVLVSYFVIQVGTVERRFKNLGIQHSQRFLDIVLHFGRSRSR